MIQSLDIANVLRYISTVCQTMACLLLRSLYWIVRVSEPKTSSKRLECRRGAVSCRERPIRSLKASLAWWFIHNNRIYIHILFIYVLCCYCIMIDILISNRLLGWYFFYVLFWKTLTSLVKSVLAWWLVDHYLGNMFSTGKLR